MKTIRTWAILAAALAFLGLGALFFSYLSISDIYHREEDPSLEWGILILTLFVLLFLIVATFILTGLTFRGIAGQAPVKIWAVISSALGVGGLVLLTLSTLVLTGIHSGEGGSPAEWALLRLAFLALIVLIVAIFISTSLIFKHFRARKSGKD